MTRSLRHLVTCLIWLRSHFIYALNMNVIYLMLWYKHFIWPHSRHDGRTQFELFSDFRILLVPDVHLRLNLHEDSNVILNAVRLFMKIRYMYQSAYR